MFNDLTPLLHVLCVLCSGLGVPRNVTEAMLWYDKAYAQGHWRAPYSLALLYDPGNTPKGYPRLLCAGFCGMFDVWCSAGGPYSGWTYQAASSSSTALLCRKYASFGAPR
jgi:TPR repeat protein